MLTEPQLLEKLQGVKLRVNEADMRLYKTLSCDCGVAGHEVLINLENLEDARAMSPEIYGKLVNEICTQLANCPYCGKAVALVDSVLQLSSEQFKNKLRAAQFEAILHDKAGYMDPETFVMTKTFRCACNKGHTLIINATQLVEIKAQSEARYQETLLQAADHIVNCQVCRLQAMI